MLQCRLPTALSARTSVTRFGARAAVAKRDMASATAHDQTATLSLGCFWHPVSCCLKALQCMNGLDNVADLLGRMLSSANCQVSTQPKWGTQEAHRVSFKVSLRLACTIRAGLHWPCPHWLAEQPTYQSVCGGDGHTESLQLTYDPSRLSYNDILQVGTGFPHV